MTESPLPLRDPWGDIDEPSDRRRTLVIGGFVLGALVLAGGGFLLLRGGAASTDAFTAPLHRVVPTGVASPSLSPSAEAQLQIFSGSIGRDPFEAPQRVQLALAPKVAPAPPAAPGAPGGASAAPAAGATPVVPAAPLVPSAPVVPGLPVAGAVPPGAAIPVVPPGTGTTSGSGTASGPGATQPVQFVQLIAAHRTGTGWVVDVRTAKGITKGIKEGTKDVGGSLFFFVGEDEQAGKPTFVFTVGESAGGNLVADPKAAAPPAGTAPKPDGSTLVLHRGQVDGGISAP